MKLSGILFIIICALSNLEAKTYKAWIGDSSLIISESVNKDSVFSIDQIYSLKSSLLNSEGNVELYYDKSMSILYSRYDIKTNKLYIKGPDKYKYFEYGLRTVYYENGQIQFEIKRVYDPPNFTTYPIYETTTEYDKSGRVLAIMFWNRDLNWWHSINFTSGGQLNTNKAWTTDFTSIKYDSNRAFKEAAIGDYTFYFSPEGNLIKYCQTRYFLNNGEEVRPNGGMIRTLSFDYTSVYCEELK